MSPQQLLFLAVAALTGLAILRVARVRLGRTPLPEGKGRRLFQLAFLVVPPVAIGALVQPAEGWTLLRGAPSIPLYAVILAGLTVLMVITAVIAQLTAPIRFRRVVLLVLVGSEGEPDDLPFDPPVTTRLAEGMAEVDRANAVFPRGLEFPKQVERADFPAAWDALDVATRGLETRIADDRRLRLGVASAATTTAADARGRLDTLRRMALDRGLSAAV